MGGHSAGGHLTQMISMHPETRELIKGGMSISGPSGLGPFIHSFANKPWGAMLEGKTLGVAGAHRGGSGLHLTPEHIEDCSPARIVRKMKRGEKLPALVLAWGAGESGLMLMVETFVAKPWLEKGGWVKTVPVENRKHFDVLLDLEEPGGILLKNA